MFIISNLRLSLVFELTGNFNSDNILAPPILIFSIKIVDEPIYIFFLFTSVKSILAGKYAGYLKRGNFLRSLFGITNFFCFFGCKYLLSIICSNASIGTGFENR